MTARARWRCDFPWTLAASGLAIAATASAFASAGIADLLVADGRIAHGQLWRALTGPLVHATWGHLVRDLALVAIAGAAYEAPLRPLRTPLFVGGLVLPGLAVLAAGDAQWYCGLSGLSHALLAAALSYELVRRRGAARAAVLALCAVSVLKPIYELVTGTPAFAMPLGDDVAQVPLAHVAGVLAGIACGLLAGTIPSKSAGQYSIIAKRDLHRTSLRPGRRGARRSRSISRIDREARAIPPHL